MTDLQPPGGMVLADMRNAIDLVGLPGGSEDFQRRLMEAEQTDAADLAAIGRLISLAHATQAVADAGIDELFTSWYRHMAQRLLRRSIDALVAIEASAARPWAGELN